jgi:cell division protein FtsB
MNDKDHILVEVDSLIAPQKRLGVRYLIKVLLAFSIVWLLLFPKIFLQSQIYYKSRDIAVQSREYEALKEENRIIKAKVESIRFKYQVLDTLFD